MICQRSNGHGVAGDACNWLSVTPLTPFAGGGDAGDARDAAYTPFSKGRRVGGYTFPVPGYGQGTRPHMGVTSVTSRTSARTCIYLSRIGRGIGILDTPAAGPQHTAPGRAAGSPCTLRARPRPATRQPLTALPWPPVAREIICPIRGRSGAGQRGSLGMRSRSVRRLCHWRPQPYQACVQPQERNGQKASVSGLFGQSRWSHHRPSDGCGYTSVTSKQFEKLCRGTQPCFSARFSCCVADAGHD